jgi:uncharacterized protein (TIGR02594 family)
MIVTGLLLLGLFSGPVQARRYRQASPASALTCDDRYPHTCEVRSSELTPRRLRKARTTRSDDSARGRSAIAMPSNPSSLVSEARRWIGTNPTGKANLWCARFMNFVLERAGYRGTGSDLAMSFRHYGRSVSGPQVGAIAVLSRRGGGHVGIVSAVDANGNPVIISGNHGRRVGEGVYSRGRVIAYVMP